MRKQPGTPKVYYTDPSLKGCMRWAGCMCVCVCVSNLPPLGCTETLYPDTTFTALLHDDAINRLPSPFCGIIKRLRYCVWYCVVTTTLCIGLHRSNISVHCERFTINNFHLRTYIPLESKKQNILLLPTTLPTVDRFSKFFQQQTQHKCVVKWSLTPPPHLKRIATLLCKTYVSEN